MFRRAFITVTTAIVLIASVSAAPAAPQFAPTPSSTPQRVTTLDLTRIYRGDDGGALYLRLLDGKVYGFGEHPGLKYAYVLTGTVSGDLIVGSWWDVPKGTRAFAKGTLRLRFSQQGAKLVRSGGHDLGPDAFDAIPPTGIPWPNRQVAGFQATTASDLDGVFVGADASRHYVRETAGDTVWVAERAAQPGERPGWVSVFVGKRSSSGTGLSGTFVDVPKGIELRSGPFGAGIVSGERDVIVAQPGTSRSTRLVPDYAIDWDRFASTIESTLDGNVVGYAYAIARDGAFWRVAIAIGATQCAVVSLFTLWITAWLRDVAGYGPAGVGRGQLSLHTVRLVGREEVDPPLWSPVVVPAADQMGRLVVGHQASDEVEETAHRVHRRPVGRLDGVRGSEEGTAVEAGGVEEHQAVRHAGESSMPLGCRTWKTSTAASSPCSPRTAGCPSPTSARRPASRQARSTSA